MGDSSAILLRNNGESTVKLCEEIDTAESNQREVERIEKSGGIVLKVGQIMRVQGEIAVTRAIGDYKYKEFIITEPHIVHTEIRKEYRDEYLIIASDGLWNTLSFSEVSNIVYQNKEKTECEISELLHKIAREKDSQDNITVLIINLAKRERMQQDGLDCPPPAPTSKYTTSFMKKFDFSQFAGNL